MELPQASACTTGPNSMSVVTPDGPYIVLEQKCGYLELTMGRMAAPAPFKIGYGFLTRDGVLYMGDHHLLYPIMTFAEDLTIQMANWATWANHHLGFTLPRVPQLHHHEQLNLSPV